MSSDLITLFKTIPDPRGAQGRRYPLYGILVLSLAAVLSGCDSLAGIFRWGRRLSQKDLRVLGFYAGNSPCHSCFYYIFSALDIGCLEDIFVQALENSDHIALDGKTIKASRTADRRGSALHILNAFCLRLQAVVGSLAVPSKRNEISMALELLAKLPIEGKLISGDALLTQREICGYITGKGGDYFFTVKGNQQTLRNSIAASFCEDSALRAPDITAHTTVEKGHGRIEKRTIEVSRDAVPYICWPGLGQVCKIKRKRITGNKESTQTVYAITSLTKKQANPEKLLQIARDHWQIENRLHHIKDTTFKEDQCRIRNKKSAAAMATLRNTAITLLRKITHNNIKAATEYMAANPKNAIKLSLYGIL